MGAWSMATRPPLRGPAQLLVSASRMRIGIAAGLAAARLAAKVVTKMTEPPAQAKTTAAKKPTGPQEVAKPTAKEVTGDEIKY